MRVTITKHFRLELKLEGEMTIFWLEGGMTCGLDTIEGDSVAKPHITKNKPTTRI